MLHAPDLHRRCSAQQRRLLAASLLPAARRALHFPPAAAAGGLAGRGRPPAGAAAALPAAQLLRQVSQLLQVRVFEELWRKVSSLLPAVHRCCRLVAASAGGGWMVR